MFRDSKRMTWEEQSTITPMHAEPDGAVPADIIAVTKLPENVVDRQLKERTERALALVEDGWILRSDVIWHKPNAMPHSVKNRPTTDHEYIFMFSKSRNYYYDADAIREPHITFTEHSKMRGGRNHLGKKGGTPEAGKNAGKKVQFIFQRSADGVNFINHIIFSE